MDIKEQILTALGLNKAEEEIKLAWQSKGEDGTIYVSTAEELEAGVDISVLTEDGTTILLPVGMYKMEDGFSFRVEKEGVVSEIMEKTEDKEDKEDKEEKEEKEEMSEETELDKHDEEEDYDEHEEADVADWKGMENRIKNLEDAVADLKREKVGGDDKVEEMSEETKEPTKKEEISDDTMVELSSDDEIKKLKEENEKLKTELAASPADSPINTNKFSSDNKVSLSKKELSKLTKREKYFYELYK